MSQSGLGSCRLVRATPQIGQSVLGANQETLLLIEKRKI